MKLLFAQYHVLPPPLDIQHEIIARIETERAIVEGNRELIRFAPREEKVKRKEQYQSPNR